MSGSVSGLPQSGTERPDLAAGLAVDIGGTTTRVALVEGECLLERREMPTDAHSGPDDLLRRLLALIADLGPLEAGGPLGVACTGRVHSGRVTAVNQATMPGWTDLPLKDWLEQALQVPVSVLNDAKAAALAEWSARPQDQAGNFMFVTVSTGIGSGLVLGERLHQAPGGQDVGLGFTSGPDGEALEYGASGTALRRVAQAGGYPDVASLFDAAERGSKAAKHLLGPALSALARRIQDAHCLLGLDVVCLGGSVGLRGYTRMFLQAALEGPSSPAIRAAVHGADAGLIGAALYARGQTLQPHSPGGPALASGSPMRGG